MSTQLTLLENTITIPGVHLGVRGMQIEPTVPDAELPQIGHRLLRVRGFMRWALGALFAEMIQRQGDDTLNAYCEGEQIDPKDRREMLAVHTFYPQARRTIELSYEHYREAMWGVDDNRPRQLERALGYLECAAKQGWSVTQLRRAIRLAQATQRPEPPVQQELAGYAVIFDMRRYCARELQRLDTLTPEIARKILDDLGAETVQYIDHLMQLAGQSDPAPGRKAPVPVAAE